MARKSLIASVLTVLSLIALASAADEPSQYQDYEPTSLKTLYFELVYSDKSVEIIVPSEGTPKRFAFDKAAFSAKAGSVSMNGAIVFDEQGLRLDGEIYPFENITDSRVRLSGDETVISFYTRTGNDSRIQRIHKGNVIEPFEKTIVVNEDDFVRGLIFTVTGNIEVYGEVNEDVISLFGDVFVAPGATVRGDVVSVAGRADAARDASVYGEVYSGKEGIRGRQHRFRRENHSLEISSTSDYNRVDGLMIQSGAKYTDRDSLIPSVWANGGYAFASERWRYDFGLEQTILRSRPLLVGGSLYRKLESEDTLLLSRGENSLMALVAREDFMDYYEAEGGEAYVKFLPLSKVLFKGGYRYEQTRWLKAHHHLWSLFGGNKLFGDNFASVDLNSRKQGIAEIDSTSNSTLFADLAYDTRDTANPFSVSAWALSGDFEWSSPKLNSDFDYNRYRLTAIRYQRLNNRLMVIVRGVYGASDGYLPMYKRFYLGGLGTLHGYKQKEYMGSRFWMFNTEYRANFPKTDLAAALFWDVGQISRGATFTGEDEVKNSLGMAVYFGDDVKIMLAKRLDRSEDDTPKFYVRLARVF